MSYDLCSAHSVGSTYGIMPYLEEICIIWMGGGRGRHPLCKNEKPLSLN